MKISIDTKEDSHEEIKKVIKMLQNLVGDHQEEIFTNQQTSEQISAEPEPSSVFSSIFNDPPSQNQQAQEPQSAGHSDEANASKEESESTEDLFAELFSEEDLKKMEQSDVKKEDDEDEGAYKQKSKRPNIELY